MSAAHSIAGGANAHSFERSKEQHYLYSKVMVWQVPTAFASDLRLIEPAGSPSTEVCDWLTSAPFHVQTGSSGSRRGVLCSSAA